MVGLGDGGEFFAVEIFITIEAKTIFTEKLFSDVLRFELLAFGDEFAGDFIETFEVTAVIVGRVEGAAFFDFEMLEKILD